jgi:hypothetical protein
MIIISKFTLLFILLPQFLFFHDVSLHPEMNHVICDSDSKTKESVEKLGTCASARKNRRLVETLGRGSSDFVGNFLF